MAQLVFIDGAQMGRSVTLSSVNTLGRDVDNSIVLAGEEIEGHHAVIRYRDGEYRLARAMPKALIMVNARDITEEGLRHGDIVTLGPVTVLFSDEHSSLPSDYVDPGQEDVMLAQSVIESRVKLPTDPAAILSTFQKNERLASHLETLYRVSAAISATLKLDDLCKALIDILFNVLAPDRAFILLYDELGNLRVAGQRTSERSELRGFVRISRTIINEAVQKREGILTRDASADQRFSHGLSIVEQNIQSAMCSPIIKQDRILGAIHVDTLNQTRNFTSFDLQLLGGIAAQAALAIENVLSYERSIERSHKLIGLGETSRRISSFLSSEMIFREAVDSVARIFDATKVSLLMLDEPSKTLKVAYSTHLPPEVRASVSIKPGEGAAGFVFAQNIPIRVTDAATPERAYESRACMIVPIVARREGLRGESKPVGVLCVTDRRNRRSFEEEDQELLTIFAAQIGVSLQNARFFEKATVDELTQLFTRQYFFARLEEEVDAHRAQKMPLSILMLDLDHFHQKNQEYKHAGGDVLLAGTAKLLRDRMAPMEGIAGRYGGEEFVAFLPGKDLEAAKAVGEQIRAAIETTTFVFEDRKMLCTVSIGAAELAASDSFAKVVQRADEALFKAKDGGRNRVVAAPSPAPEDRPAEVKEPAPS
ncbi:MAG: diguanylate cyclase [Planctomycetes bacterium]|nr:diguanylate cyclase [Planctomycetota bacterium]